MSTCISRHGEYSSHTFGEGAERFVCQWCGVLDEDAMIDALATAEAEVERLRDEVIERLRQFNIAKDQRDIMVTRADRVAAAEAERDELRAEVKRLCADVSDSSRLIWKQAQLLTDVVNAVRGEPGRLELHSHHDAPELVQAVVADRDALSARLQAVRVLADEGEHECSEACELFNCDANRRYLVAKDRILDALDASLGTPEGDGYCVCNDGWRWADCGIAAHRAKARPLGTPDGETATCSDCNGSGLLWDITADGSLSRPCPCGCNPLILRNSPVGSPEGETAR